MFLHMDALKKMKNEKTGIESHSSLGIAERFNQPIRTVYRKLRLETPKMSKYFALSLAVKSRNDVSGPKGHVPSALTFGEYSHIFLKLEKERLPPTNVERTNLSNRARNLWKE